MAAATRTRSCIFRTHPVKTLKPNVQFSMKILKLFILSLACASPYSWAQQETAPQKVSADATAEARKIVLNLEKHLSGKSRLAYDAKFTSDVVLDNGQKIQIAGATRVYFKRPNQLMVELQNDHINRLFYHDGRQLTAIAPNEKTYGMIEANASSMEALEDAANNYGVDIPLIDLIAWGVNGTESLTVDSAVYVGETELQEKTVDHWAFRGPRLDWELWITRGENPLPLKISTVRYHDLSQPRFTANINWNERSSMKDSLFEPNLEKDFRKVPLTQLKTTIEIEGKEAKTEAGVLTVP